MKKKILPRFIKIFSLLLVLILCVSFLQEYILCLSNHNHQRVKDFYLEDKNSLDVIMMGSSEVYAAYSACHAYEKFGFTSYSLATEGNLVWNYKHELREIEKRQNPKLIIIEVNGALYGNDDYFHKDATFRQYADHWPLNHNKVELIDQNVSGDKLDYYFPIIKYHSVWKDFPKGLGVSLALLQDQARGYSYLKGEKNVSAVYKPTEKIYNDYIRTDETRDKLSPLSEKYLIEFLEYCKAENIDNIVFVRFPHVITAGAIHRHRRSNTIEDIVTEYGYDYINCEKYFDETGLSVQEDFYNKEHLNIYGQRKFTEYLGRIIQDEYGITKTELTPTQKDQWDNCVKYYHAYCQYNEDLIAKNGFMAVSNDYRNHKEIQKYLK